MTKNEFQKQLEKIAFLKTIPYCYSCQEQAPTGRCSRCMSDDLMRLMPGIGCEYGTEWVVEELLRALTPVDVEKRFEDSISECYPQETLIGWTRIDTIWAIKQLTPWDWTHAKDEWAYFEEQEGNIISFDNGSTFYDPSDLEKFTEENLNISEEAV